MLFLSTTDWDVPQFGSRQQIAMEFVRRGHRVLFVEIPRALHSFISDPAGTRRSLRRMGRIRQIPGGPLAYTPLPVFPVYYHPLTNALSQRLLVRYVRAAVARLRWRIDVLWTYWPNTAYMIGRLGEHVAVYHCIDDFVAAGYPLTSPQYVARMEAEQCRRVDIVFARTERLASARRQHNPNTHLLPGGVDARHFDPARSSVPHRAIDILPRPRVGLVGTIDDRVDTELIGYCARNLPHATFVLVGPVKKHRVDVRCLEDLPNVHMLPPCSHAQVPSIVAGLDVCLVPYRVNAYTEGVSPIKLYEYLAMGKPVVTTDLPYLRREARHIQIGQTREQFLVGIEKALCSAPTDKESAAWRAAAEAQSWSRQVDEIEQHLQVLLEER